MFTSFPRCFDSIFVYFCIVFIFFCKFLVDLIIFSRHAPHNEHFGPLKLIINVIWMVDIWDKAELHVQLLELGWETTNSSKWIWNFLPSILYLRNHVNFNQYQIIISYVHDFTYFFVTNYRNNFTLLNYFTFEETRAVFIKYLIKYNFLAIQLYVCFSNPCWRSI